jgi:lipopolysaccharide/colanic/teichoic acid biosynthesis glycosyltransferase
MKRVIDFLLAAIGLVLLAPLMLILFLLVKFNLGSPVLFRQKRAGLGGVPFEIIKFRSMLDSFDVQGILLPDNQRLTALGRFLRSTSLDELPELWNVIRGEMSLVGPRPLLVEYLPLYSNRQARRHEVLPGITGLAQVNGRNLLSWEEKFHLDVWYVENQSIKLDLNIIWQTIWSVLKRNGVSAKDAATMPPFDGTSSN